jgi:protein-disulfide isomerase|tara:strand:- start:1846 stop:2541 length:696 start_codon:yes stop_codon:yes gene_type:complete
MSEQITIKKETVWKVLTFVFAALWLFGMYGGANVVNDPTVVPPTVQNPPTGNIKVTIDNSDPILGDKDADITIVEFSDFQCPFCERAANGAVAEFKQSSYFKNGDVRLAFKHLPLNSIHPQAQKAAEASACAQDQGKFWEMHDAIFANQRALSIDNLKSYAGQIGLNQGKFDSCLDGGKKAGKVANDMKQAGEAGGKGTPYFVLINEDGKTTTVSGAQPWVNFEAAIKSLQ